MAAELGLAAAVAAWAAAVSIGSAAAPAAAAAPEAAAAAANMPVNPPVDIDVEDGNDGDKAPEQARQIRVEFEPNDIKFWFAPFFCSNVPMP